MASLMRASPSTSVSCSRGSRAALPVRPAVSRRGVAARSVVGSKELVRDIMTSGAVITCKPSDSIDAALEMLVEHRVTGLPVIDEHNKCVGVVSDFDLLALETFGRTNNAELFPEVEQTWQAFMQVRTVLAKGTGKQVKDVMTAHPITVKPDTNINDATSILLSKKIRRLPVVDNEGRLIGLLSRRDIVKAALETRKMANLSTIDGGAPISTGLMG